ncbi:recombinase family protein [Streptomyces sp. NBC_01751]|uniref:recombinase family protein n=1 Tax=Streptomyces sp. NBC_01751 TaxID=2975929 RepID=UPI002DD89D2F|nr:recombinase family protein [Streptomyces sp. NBC_01751]WSD24512.1 recombinase family protein [Streptomyces sp. NBC_01751]
MTVTGGVRRVLLARRISDDKGEISESVEEQTKRLRTRAFDEGVIIAGEPEDLSVSGDVDFVDRPALGQWMTPEGREMWDDLWVTNQDRLSRNELHVMSFIIQMLGWKKGVVVLDDPEFTEQMKTPEGRAIIHVKALGPHKELERIKARNKDSHARRRYTVKWPGGIPPFGYVAEQRFENGKTATYLKLDEDMQKVLYEMRRLMVDESQSFSGVAAWLNNRSVLTARDRARIRKGKPVKRRGGAVGEQERWSETSVKLLLTDEALLGYKKHDRQVLYDDQGAPIRVAGPSFTTEEWSTLQAACAQRRITTTRRVNGTSPMYGVAHCSKCLSKAVHKVSVRIVQPPKDDPEQESREVTYRYYQCGAWPKPERCVGISCRAEIAEELVEIMFLQKYGQRRVTKRVWVPGNDTSEQLDELDKRIKRLRRQDEDGDWDDDREGYRERMTQLKNQRKELSAIPVRKSGWIEQDQGKTYLELWPSLDLEGQRKQLIEAGFKIMIGSKTAWLDETPLEGGLRLEEAPEA